MESDGNFKPYTTPKFWTPFHFWTQLCWRIHCANIQLPPWYVWHVCGVTILGFVPQIAYSCSSRHIIPKLNHG